MTNTQRANELLRHAELILREAEVAFQQKAWNLCIRRSQELVELLLKAMLVQMGKDYPRIHDAAPIVLSILQRSEFQPEPEFAQWLLGFSRDLAEKRAPAFYFEQAYSEEDAEIALQGTRRIFNFAKSFFDRN